jgi:hypothetical protein
MKINLKHSKIVLSVHYSDLFFKFVKQIIHVPEAYLKPESIVETTKSINLFYLKGNGEYEKDL